jgi:hypothetical protein
MNVLWVLVLAAAGFLTTAPAVAQLMNSDADQLWTDKPLNPQTQRRDVTYCIDPPPAGAPAGLVQAVEDAVAAWAKTFPGGIQFVSTANCATADVRVGWAQNQPSWGTTSARAGGTGQRAVTLETRDNGGWLTPQQVENIARHEFGHVKGLRDNAASGVMKPIAAKGGLAGADWPIGTVDVGANRSKYFDFYDVVRPPIYASVGIATPSGTGFVYAYNLNLANTAVAPVRSLNVTTLAAMQIQALPPGWNAHLLDAAEDKGPGHFAPATMVCTAAPGFEVMPGQSANFQFFSPGVPQNGWVFAVDAAGEMAEIGDTPSMVTPGQTPIVFPGMSPPWLAALALLLVTASAGVLARRSRRGGSARA